MTTDAKSRRVRLGFIGTGWWATANHIPLLASRTDTEVVAVCDPKPELLEQVAGRFSVPFATRDFVELLEQDLDGVVVTSPHHLHHEHAREALLRGVHVLCEKPMCLVPDQAWELVEIARERRLHLLVAYGWHYKQFVGEAKRWLDEGAVGQIEYILCHMASPAKELFASRPAGAGAAGPLLVEPDASTWQVRSHGGGYGYGQITHSSALLLWLTGLRAREVTSRMSAPGASVDLYDAATVVFEDETIAALSGAATLPKRDKFQIDLRIFGDEGVLILDMERERLELRRHDGAHRRVEVPPGEGAYSCEGPPNRFVDLLRGIGENDSPGEVAARSVELVDAMYRSAAAGGTPTLIRSARKDSKNDIPRAPLADQLDKVCD